MAKAIPRSQLTIYNRNNWPPEHPVDYNQGAAFLIDKPEQWSSFKVVKRMRAALDVKKVGHAGTLDPLARGLLIVCCGRATKSISQFQELPKEYRAEITLGQSTPSYDSETEPDEFAEWKHITRDEIEHVLDESFDGTILQTPPVYSAIKQNGERLYKKVRRGEKVKAGQRSVTLHETEILDFDAPRLLLKIRCSKGTYIRSIAHDMGIALDSRAYLSGLVRTAIGEYSVEDALPVTALVSNLS